MTSLGQPTESIIQLHSVHIGVPVLVLWISSRGIHCLHTNVNAGEEEKKMMVEKKKRRK
jgi:hypothetical protein